jgi:hypothetical protein
MSECSQPEDENNKNKKNKMAKVEEAKGELKKRANTQNIFQIDGSNFDAPRMTMADQDRAREQIIEEEGSLMKRA